MSGKYRALFLLAVLFWQSLTVLNSLSLVQHAREGTSQTSGERHALYQHHLDQSVHKSGESDTAAHFHVSGVADLAAVMSGECAKPAVRCSQHAVGILAVASQTPFLPGLLRPPQVLA